MYRFRTIDNLLGKHQELERQEIYFASPDELNDPMEGYKDVFWRGDAIVWRNFIINYVKSAEQIFALAILLREDRPLDDSDIKVLSHHNNYPTAEYREIIKQIINKIFEVKFISDLPNALADRINPIRREELISYLELIHPFVIDTVSETYFKNKLTRFSLLPQKLDGLSTLLNKQENVAFLINKMEQADNRMKAELFFSRARFVTNQSNLLAKYNFQGKKIPINSFFLLSEFPERYVSKMESSIYPQWYSASFLYECSNSSIWGHYGDNHRGVCLKFKTQKIEDGFEINLNTEYGYSSGPISGMRPHRFKEIKYDSKYIKIDFFKSIARLNKMQIKVMWYTDDNGNLSSCGEHLEKDEDQWRRGYWDNFYESFAVKLKEWAYEQEYRLVIHGDFVDYTSKDSRKLSYDFNDLEGIIFGIKTSISDKIQIIKIIEEKCQKYNRTDFDFYQAHYSTLDGKIDISKLNLLKLKKSTNA